MKFDLEFRKLDSAELFELSSKTKDASDRFIMIRAVEEKSFQPVVLLIEKEIGARIISTQTSSNFP